MCRFIWKEVQLSHCVQRLELLLFGLLCCGLVSMVFSVESRVTGGTEGGVCKLKPTADSQRNVRFIPPTKREEPLDPHLHAHYTSVFIRSFKWTCFSYAARFNSSEVIECSYMMSDSSCVSGAPQRLMPLALRGEWMALEQKLKTLEKGDPDIFQFDQVRCTADAFYCML